MQKLMPSGLVSGLVIAALVLTMTACGGKTELELIASAKELSDKNDIKGAVIQLKSAIQKNPQSAEARLLLGKALLGSGDPVSALVELLKAQELQTSDELVIPEIARAMLLVREEKKLLAQYGTVRLQDPGAQADLRTSVAAAHALRGESEQAADAVAAALQVRPGYAPALVLQARLTAAAGDIDEALALVSQVLQKEPSHEAAGQLRGDLLWHGKQDTTQAIDAFRTVLTNHPAAVNAHTSLVTLFRGIQKPEEAKAQFEKMKVVAPNHPETLFFEAQFAFTNDDFQATREITDRLLKAMPENVRLLELAGAAAYRQKQYALAEDFLGRALKNAPGLPVSRKLLAQTYLRTHQPSKAVEVLLPLVEGKSPDGTSLALAGEAWMQMGEVKKAEAAFALASKVAPDDPRVRTSAALAQMARGNGGAAIGQLEAIAADDKGPRADIALISARLKQNDIAGALKAIDGLEKKTPDRPIAHNLRGRVLLLKRDLEGAAKSFEMALSKDPHYFPAVASLAALDFSAGKVDAARKRFEDLTKAKPKSHEAWMALSELAVRTGAPPEDVVKHMRDAIRANAGEPAPHLALINHYISAGDGKSALTAAREATGALPSNLVVMEALGRSQLAADNAEQAVTTFRQLAAQQNTNPMHQVRLAEALLANKDAAGARRALNQALEMKPDLIVAKRALVSIALMENRPQDGMSMAREMQKQAPKDANGFALEGDIEIARKNPDAAVAAYRTAMSLNKSTEVFVRLHTALRLAGKSGEAERLAADWLKDRPKDAAFRYYLGDVALSQNQMAAAEGHYRAVLEMQPRNALAMNNVAWLMVQQGKPGAVAVAEKANELMPGKPPLMDTLATALAADNKLPKAIEMQKAAIARSPADPSLKLNLAKLLIKSGDKAYARAELEDLAKLGDKFRAQAEVAALLKTL